MAHDVFISYSASDSAVAQAVREAVEGQGIACWIAPRDIPPGAEWAGAIISAIATAPIMLLIHSANSNTSPMVLHEVNAAVSNKKTVLPVRIDAAPIGDAMQFYLGSTHWVDVATMQPREYLPRLVAAIRDNLAKNASGAEIRPVNSQVQQQIRYCRAPDGARLAYTTIGQGPVLVKTANWMTHLELDWNAQAVRSMLEGLAREHTLLRYDARGSGLSDWDVKKISLDAWVSDLEAVVDAAKLERFPLFGMSQGCSVAISYAVRHPERVSHLLLLGGFAAGPRHRGLSVREMEAWQAMKTLMRVGWSAPDAAFRQLFTSQFMPDSTKEQWESFNEIQRASTSAEGAERYMDAVGDINVSDLLGAVRTPTLVMHARHDVRVPFEFGRMMAAGIPDARFVALPGRNHILQEGEPALARFLEEAQLFLGQ